MRSCGWHCSGCDFLLADTLERYAPWCLVPCPGESKGGGHLHFAASRLPPNVKHGCSSGIGGPHDAGAGCVRGYGRRRHTPHHDRRRLLSKLGKDWQLLPGNSTPSNTLLAGPIILIGVHANRWTPTITKNLRFFFGVENAIYDRSDPRVKWSLDQLTPDWKTNEDYALVSRFTNPGSGQPVIVIAGLTNFGTQAAGDFLTNQSLLSEALQKAPKDWKHKNFQFVLHTQIIGNSPERPTVIASNYW